MRSLISHYGEALYYNSRKKYWTFRNLQIIPKSENVSLNTHRQMSLYCLQLFVLRPHSKSRSVTCIKSNKATKNVSIHGSKINLLLTSPTCFGLLGHLLGCHLIPQELFITNFNNMRDANKWLIRRPRLAFKWSLLKKPHKQLTLATSHTG